MSTIKNADIFTKKLLVRALTFFITFVLYIIDSELLVDLLHFKFLGIQVYQYVWSLLMIEMVFVLVPSLNKYVSTGKCFQHHHIPVEDYKQEHLKSYMRQYNLRAALTFTLWMLFIATLTFFHIKGYIKNMHILLFVVFLYFLDHCFITIWCPFKAFLMKNKCCSACRIYNWNHAMIFSPLIMIPNFWTYSLLVFAIIIMLYWEYAVHKYPERFSELTNKKLQCSHCEMKCYKN